jgi:hypothetical protein
MDCAGQLGVRLGCLRGNRDTCAVTRSAYCYRQADAPAAACDEEDFSLERAHTNLAFGDLAL